MLASTTTLPSPFDNSLYPYTPLEAILLSCGSTDNFADQDDRRWLGDNNSQYFPMFEAQNNASVASAALSKAFFLNIAGSFILLSNFSALLSAAAIGQDVFFKEFWINSVEEDQG
ncbi:hypothetical protein Pint_18985 [Pistacia integerrima]|uniref:Uncharacterized protein n=1 Tax=Pistacia integerrima TaxID=434235 RepID=A0ACC0YVR2_9ROSI|nr:hypothetical protein Pint_18985 [Pistacia integerrima]